MTTIYTKDKQNILFMTGYVKNLSMLNALTNALRRIDNTLYYKCTDGYYRTKDGRKYKVRNG